LELSVRDVADLLHTDEKTIYGFIDNGSIPAYHVGEQYRFNRVEILEWANSHRVHVSARLFAQQETSGSPLSVSEALTVGGIAYSLSGNDKHEVLKNAVAAMQLPASVDREHLLQLLIARETLASTAIGDGIAIPHVRHPIVMHLAQPTITLCLLDHPVDFGALDSKPVHCMFMMVSPTVRTHLQLISKLAYALKDEELRHVLERRGTREEIFASLSRIESAMKRPATDPARQE